MKTEPNNYKKKLRRNLALLRLDSFLVCLSLVYPILVLLFESVSGSFALAMSVFSVTSITVVCMEVPTGVLSDRWGRKPVLILSNLSSFLAYTCFAIACYGPLGTLWLFTGAFFMGLGTALYSGNNQALLYETLRAYRREKDYAKINGRIRAMEQVGLCLSGIVAGAALWLQLSFGFLALLTLFPMGLSVLLAFLIVEPKAHCVEETKSFTHIIKSVRRVLRHPRLRWYALASGISNGLGMAGHYLYPGFIASVWPLWATPFYKTAQHAIGAVSFWFSGAIVNLFGPLRTLWFGHIASSILAAIAYLLNTVLSPFILLVNQINYATSQTAESAVQQGYFTDRQRSTLGSLISFFTEIITAIGAIGLGFLADLTNPAIALLAMLLLRTVPMNAIYAYLYRHRGWKQA